MRETESTNPERVQLIRFLKKQARETQANIWLDVAEHLAKANRQRVAVNLSQSDAVLMDMVAHYIEGGQEEGASLMDELTTPINIGAAAIR